MRRPCAGRCHHRVGLETCPVAQHDSFHALLAFVQLMKLCTLTQFNAHGLGAAKKFGVKASEIYWTLGAYDVVAIFEAPDDHSITALALALGDLAAKGATPAWALTSIARWISPLWQSCRIIRRGMQKPA